MPLNSTTFLTTQGWEGAGVPLDGKGGKGLKKPLAIPQKRGLKGLGKERDRAVEWWDCLFETSAKTLNIGIPSSSKLTTLDAVKVETASSSSSIASTPSLSSPLAANPPLPSTSLNPSSSSSRLSIQSAAKREYARRVLMSSFVKARPELLPKPISDQPLSKPPAPSIQTPESSVTIGLPIEATVDECGRALQPGNKSNKSDDGRKGKTKSKPRTESSSNPKEEDNKKKKKKKRKDKTSTSESHSVKDVKGEKKNKRKRREKEDSRSSSKEVDELIPGKRKRSDEDRRVEGKAKKAKKEQKKPSSSDAPEVHSIGDDSKMLSKQRRRIERAEKKARREARAIKRAEKASKKKAKTSS